MQDLKKIKILEVERQTQIYRQRLLSFLLHPNWTECSFDF